VVGLAPLLVLSVACVTLALAWPAAAGYLLLAAIVNASGAIGDLWMAWRTLRLPRAALFYDLADGFAALVAGGGDGPQEALTPNPSPSRGRGEEVF
jgi:hypothetical protein